MTDQPRDPRGRFAGERDQARIRQEDHARTIADAFRQSNKPIPPRVKRVIDGGKPDTLPPSVPDGRYPRPQPGLYHPDLHRFIH